MVGYKVTAKILYVFEKLLFGIKVYGRENVPTEGGYLVACNHISNWDPTTVGVSFPRQLRFMAKKELFEHQPLAGIIRMCGAFPVDRSVGDMAALRAAINILSEGNCMVMFPEGTRNGGRLLKAKPGVAMIALHAKVPVIPMFISGKYHPFGKLRVRIGKPIDLSQYYEKKVRGSELQAIAEDILNVCRALEVK